VWPRTAKFGKFFIVLRGTVKIHINSDIFAAILLAALLLTLVRLAKTSPEAEETSTWKPPPT
jgi:hypothetical protein